MSNMNLRGSKSLVLVLFFFRKIAKSASSATVPHPRDAVTTTNTSSVVQARKIYLSAHPDKEGDQASR